jgi:hypothetical protein
MAKTSSYADAVAEAQALLAQARLNDPDEHFPYKQDVARALLDEDPPAGPNGPDDASRHVSDYISGDIIDATAAYVAAQQAYLEDRSLANRDAYHAARDELVAARLDHRVNR